MFANNLQFLRKRERITQEELADRLGVTRQSVSKWETGEAFPETDKVIALCDMFGVTMDALMRGDCTAPAKGEEGRTERPSAEQNEQEATRASEEASNARLRVIGGAVSGALMACALIAYLCLGTLGGWWHPGWLVFPLALSLCAFADGFFKRDTSKERPAVHVLRGACGMTMLLSVTLYLFLGFAYSLWHPAWVVFPVALVLAGMFGKSADALSRAFHAEPQDDDK